MKQIINAVRDPLLITDRNLLMSVYSDYLHDRFITAFLDDFLGGAPTFELAVLFVICLIDLFYNLAIFF